MKDITVLLHPEEMAGEKYRNELKYVCSEGELQIILSRIRHLCRPDPHAGESGIYCIRSVYFDDVKDSCLLENENGNDPREKFRIRIYNASDDRITLECKKKERAMTHKDSCRLTKEQYGRIVEGTFTAEEAHNKLLRKFALQIQERMLRPKVIVGYERTPFIYHVGNVRITVDRNIGSTTDIDGFFEQYLPMRPVMEKGRHILEVKYDALLPDHLYAAMNLRNLRQTAFSKYALCRKYSL